MQQLFYLICLWQTQSDEPKHLTLQTIATPFLSHSGRETVSPAKESRPKGDCDVPPLETPFVSATVRRTAPYSSAAPCSVAAAASGALSFQNRTRCAGLRFCDRYTGPLAGSTPGVTGDEGRRGRRPRRPAFFWLPLEGKAFQRPLAPRPKQEGVIKGGNTLFPP